MSDLDMTRITDNLMKAFIRLSVILVISKSDIAAPL